MKKVEIKPIIKDNKVIGAEKKVWIFGVLICKKTLILPSAYGIDEFEHYQISI